MDKKPTLSISIIKALKPGHDDKDGDKEEMKQPEGHSEGEKAAMEDFISAVKSQDVEAACEAFKNFMSVCNDGEQPEEDSEEESE